MVVLLLVLSQRCEAGRTRENRKWRSRLDFFEITNPNGRHWRLIVDAVSAIR
jgi:hypothetical protein